MTRIRRCAARLRRRLTTCTTPRRARAHRWLKQSSKNVSAATVVVRTLGRFNDAKAVAAIADLYQVKQDTPRRSSSYSWTRWESRLRRCDSIGE